MVSATNRYLLVAEYYNPIPVAIPYRGHNERLFKRDFAGEIMEYYSEMQLLDYGFFITVIQTFRKMISMGFYWKKDRPHDVSSSHPH